MPNKYVTASSLLSLKQKVMWNPVQVHVITCLQLLHFHINPVFLKEYLDNYQVGVFLALFNFVYFWKSDLLGIGAS